MSWAVIDIETTTVTTYKRKANPFDPANWVVLAGYQKRGDPLPTAVRLANPAHSLEWADGIQRHGWFYHVMNMPGLKFLVGANIKFDLLHILKDPVALQLWMRYVANGGNVWDIQLAEYLLDGQIQSSHMLSLDDMALRYGCDTKVDEVKLLWEAGVPTEDIDPDLLKRYLIGEDLKDPITKEPTGLRREGDIGNTRDIFLKQIEKAKLQGQSRSILLNMGALLATIEMERNGMFVNEALGAQLAEELAVKLQAGKAELQKYLPPNLPFQFNWTNRYHLSPLLFGGKVKYECREYDLKDGTTTWDMPLPDTGGSVHPLPHEYAYAQKDETHYIFADGSGTISVDEYKAQHADSTLSHVLRDEHLERFKGGKNAGEFKTKKVKVDDYTKPKGRMADRFFEFTGYTAPLEEWASSTPGLYSVAAEVIEALGNRKDVPFLVALSSVVGMTKDLTTYFVSTDEETGESKGMLTLVQPDHIIHHQLNHTSTVTGRFSSSNPNLQNIPKGNKSEVKRVFESRFGEDGRICQSDFSSLEVYVQAILTHCKLLIEDLKSGIDLHCMRLALKEHMDYDEVKALCKGFTDKSGVYHEAVDEWDYKRTGAKVFSFQRAYGAGAAKIAVSTGMPIEEVEALTLAEKQRWPEIDKYFEQRADEIKAARRPTSVTVPHPCNQAIMVQIGVSRVRTPDGKRYTYRETPSPSYLLKRGILASFSPTEIKNYEVQGTGGEWMKAALWLKVRAWYARENFAGLSLLVNTVHDASYKDSHKAVYVEAAALMAACMEAASDFMEWWFNWTLPLPVPTDTVWGMSMAEENGFKDAEFKARVKELRTQLRNDYMGGYTPNYLKEKA